MTYAKLAPQSPSYGHLSRSRYFAGLAREGKCLWCLQPLAKSYLPFCSEHCHQEYGHLVKTVKAPAWNGCGYLRKGTYHDEETAQRKARFVRQERGEPVVAYRCQWGAHDHWHLGHPVQAGEDASLGYRMKHKVALMEHYSGRHLVWEATEVPAVPTAEEDAAAEAAPAKGPEPLVLKPAPPSVFPAACLKQVAAREEAKAAPKVSVPKPSQVQALTKNPLLVYSC